MEMFPHAVKADIAVGGGFAQASFRRSNIVVIMPRPSKMGGKTGSGDCVGFVSSRKRNPFDQS